MKKYIFSMAFIAVIYGMNRVLLIPATVGILHNLLAWYGADFLAGALMLCVVNVLLLVSERRPMSQFWAVTLFLFGCGLFWEVVTPLYLPRSVGDPRDILACWLGGMTIYIWSQKKSSV